MTSINSQLLKQLHSKIDPTILKTFQSQLQKQSISKSQSQSNQKSRLSTSASFASRLNHSNQAQKGSTKDYSNEANTPKNNQFTQSSAHVQYRNSKAVYYRTNDLPSLHSIDSIMSECVRHTRTKRNINDEIESSDLLKVKQLQVFYCQIQSLRLFGTGWKIKSLTVIGCKLKDLSGINGFSNLQSLFAPYNQIEILSDLAFNQTLKVIDLEGNSIKNIDQIQYLLTVQNLQMVNLDYNPVMTQKKQQVFNLLTENLLDTDQYTVIESYNFRKEIEDEDEIFQKYQNVLLVDYLNSHLSTNNSYYQMIDQLKRDKYTNYTQKQFTLDGRFNEDRIISQYQLDDITIFHNPKKAFQKDSLQKYLSVKFNLPQDEIITTQTPSTKSKIFAKRTSSKKSLQNKQQVEYSTFSSKLSFKNQDFSSTGGFNNSGSQTFTDTILSRPDSQKRKFILRKTSLKKDSTLISDLNTPTTPSLKRQFLSKTNSFLNK